MFAIAARFAPPREVWETIPLEWIVSVILAGGLKAAGVMP
jgi:hypothetical protein